MCVHEVCEEGQREEWLGSLCYQARLKNKQKQTSKKIKQNYSLASEEVVAMEPRAGVLGPLNPCV